MTIKNSNVTSIHAAFRSRQHRRSLVTALGLILLARGIGAQVQYGLVRVSLWENDVVVFEREIYRPRGGSQGLNGEALFSPVEGTLSLMPGRQYRLFVNTAVDVSCRNDQSRPNLSTASARLAFELEFGAPPTWSACAPGFLDRRLGSGAYAGGGNVIYQNEMACWPGGAGTEAADENVSPGFSGQCSSTIVSSVAQSGALWRVDELADAWSRVGPGYWNGFPQAYSDCTTEQRFTVTEGTTLTLRGSIFLGVRGASQDFPELPDAFFGGGGGGGGTLVCCFRGRRRGRWYDPPLAHGFRFEATGLANFTKILAFPEEIDGDGLFRVRAGGLDLGSFAVGDSVDFAALTGGPVREFEVTDIGPLVDSGDPTAFPIQLDFDQELVDFDMEPLFTPARATWRNAGANPSSFTCTLPVLGETWQASVDLSTTGHPYAWINGYLRPATIPLRGGQVLLGKDRNVLPSGGGVPLGVVRIGPMAGPNAILSLSLPLDPRLVGTEFITQAMHFGAGQPFALSNAQDLVLGF